MCRTYPAALVQCILDYAKLPSKGARLLDLGCGTGQMTYLLGAAIEPHGHVYFAGDHCSVLPGWIEGALRSALHAVGRMTGADLSPVAPPVIC